MRAPSPTEDSGGQSGEHAEANAHPGASPASPSSANGNAPADAEPPAPEPVAAEDEGAAAWPPKEAAPEAEAAPTTRAIKEDPAAMPSQELGFSDSTMHWLEDGEQPTGPRITSPVTIPSYDPTAPVAGRRRTFVVIGGAAVIALAVAGALYLQAVRHRQEETPAATSPADPARELTSRAEAAYAANRIGEALDLAHLALAADARFADAHFVVANCERARNQPAVARDEYRKYLDLAPIGTHAEAARTALATLPP